MTYLSDWLSTSQCWAVVLLLARPESYRKDAELANSVPEGKQEQEEGGPMDRVAVLSLCDCLV